MRPGDILGMAFRAAQTFGYLDAPFRSLNDSARGMRAQLIDLLGILQRIHQAQMRDGTAASPEFRDWFRAYAPAILGRAVSAADVDAARVVNLAAAALELLARVGPRDAAAVLGDPMGTLERPEYAPLNELFAELGRALSSILDELKKNGPAD